MVLPGPCGANDSIGLVPEVVGKPAMCGHHLGGGVDLLAVTGGVRGNFGGLPTTAAGTLPILPNPLTTRAGSLQVFLGGALDLWRPAPPHCDFLAHAFQSVGLLPLS